MDSAESAKIKTHGLEFLAGCLLSYAVTVTIITKSIHLSSIICGIVGLVFFLVPIMLMAIKKAIREKSLTSKITEEEKEKYKSPFPDIDQNRGQSIIVQELYNTVVNNYNASPTMDVDEMGKMYIGAEVKKGDEFEFIKISELFLTPPDMDAESLDWQVSAAHIIENFEEACKKVLGEYKK